MFSKETYEGIAQTLRDHLNPSELQRILDDLHFIAMADGGTESNDTRIGNNERTLINRTAAILGIT